jgi:ubiquinone/menaquinone biosynthesis C-methylase UbiE
MDARDAAALIAPAVQPGGRWADLGAGTGIFTAALADLTGPTGGVYAVERDARSASALDVLAQRGGGADRAPITVIRADFTTPFALPQVDGALFANSLHFVADDEQSPLLARVADSLGAPGRILIVEYDKRPRSQWVPYPVSFSRLEQLARNTGLAKPELIGRYGSAYGGTMYAALINCGF